MAGTDGNFAGVPRGASVTELVRAILQAATRPMGAHEVIAIAKASRSAIKGAHIHTSLYRFRESKQVKVTGEKGSWMYTWEGPRS